MIIDRVSRVRFDTAALSRGAFVSNINNMAEATEYRNSAQFGRKLSVLKLNSISQLNMKLKSSLYTFGNWSFQMPHIGATRRISAQLTEK